MHEKETLYIPMGLKVHNEIFEGFGRRELIRSIISVLILGFMDFVFYAISKNVSLAVITLIISIAGSIMIFTKDRTNLSVAEQVTNMLSFVDSQKKYRYKYLDEWGINSNKSHGDKNKNKDGAI